MKLKNETFQTDSKVALGYINNNIKNFDILVASWIQQMHEGSNVALSGSMDHNFFGILKPLNQ